MVDRLTVHFNVFLSTFFSDSFLAFRSRSRVENEASYEVATAANRVSITSPSGIETHNRF